MKRVLIVTYYWPPSGGSGVQRWVKFAKYLPGEGWQPVIYTPENPEAPSKDTTLVSDIPPEAEVIKRHITEIYGLYRKLTRGGSSEVNPINGGRKSLAGRIMMSLRGNLFIPDPRRGWVGPSVRFLRRYLREHPVDAIVTTGPPHSMHLIGLRLHEKTGIPWIADFRDPWTKLFYFKHLQLSPRARRRHEVLERRVLDGASAVVAVSPLVQEEFRAMTRTPVALITNGYDPEDFDFVVEPDGYFNVTHTGLFAADGNPDVLWKVLADKCAASEQMRRLLRIRLAGKTDAPVIASIRAAGLEDNLVDLGYLSHEVTVREQKNASLLILPLRKEPEYRATLPGKLFEYLASGLPVLGVGQSDGAMAAILRDTGAGTCCEWEDYEGMSTFVDRVWTAFREGRTLPAAEGIEAYSRISTTRQMALLLEKVSR